MEPVPKRLRLKSATAIQNLFGSTESFKPEVSAASSRIRTLPSRTSEGFLRLLNKAHRNPEQSLSIATAPSSPASVQGPPPITKLAKAFADALTFQQLSDFLAWILYYDAVELPESPESWYSLIDRMEMRGWVALGEHMSTHDESDTGFDLIVLDSICDRADIDRKIVRKMLMQFAEPQKMVYSQIALAVHEADGEHSAFLTALEHVQTKLHELYRLCVRIKPTEGSTFQAGHFTTEQRLRGYLHLVVGPRIKAIRSGTPLVTAATCEQIDKDVQEGFKLNYYFEAIQQQRVVPLARYGVLSPLAPESPGSPASGYLGGETEHARTQVLELTEANQALQQQMTDLQRRHDVLMSSNEKLALKVSTMGKRQPVGYVHVRQPSTPGEWIAANSPDVSRGQQAAAAGRTQQESPFLPQSLAHKPLPATPANVRENVENVDPAGNYGGIFDGLTATSPSAFYLAEFGSGPARHFGEPATVTGAGRRRGSAFTDELNNAFMTM